MSKNCLDCKDYIACVGDTLDNLERVESSHERWDGTNAHDSEERMAYEEYIGGLISHEDLAERLKNIRQQTEDARGDYRELRAKISAEQEDRETFCQGQGRILRIKQALGHDACAYQPVLSERAKD